MRRWAAQVAAARPETLQIGYFGSYARGDWGPGSDLDIVVIVQRADEPFERRPARWDTTDLPVPADVLVYTAEEWRALAEAGRFVQVVLREAVWVHGA